MRQAQNIAKCGYWLIICMGISQIIYGQTSNTTVEGAVSFDGDAIWTDQGNIYHSGDEVSLQSTNSVYVDGSIVFSSQSAHFENGGTIDLKENWVNNSTGPAHNGMGLVRMSGAEQTISGTTNSEFYDLELTGEGKKQLVGVDVSISNKLKLFDNELATNDNAANIVSTMVDAITRNDSGFVSSEIGGYLSRKTNSVQSYLFPVGYVKNDTLFYRPVELSPTGTSLNTYTCRLAYDDATDEGYDRSIRKDQVKNVNSRFFHHLSHPQGMEPVKLRLYYDESDGEFSDILQWKGVPRWEPTIETSIISISSPAMGYAEIEEWDEFDFTPFALGVVEKGGALFVPNVFSPDGNGLDDLIRVYGAGIEQMHLEIFDRWGERVFESYEENNGWDGTFKGRPMDEAVFVYRLTGKYENGVDFEKHGNITLIR